MKKITLLIVLICSISCSGQKLSEIKKQNTFFILFEEGEYTKKTIDSSKYINNQGIRLSYRYTYHKNKDKSFGSRYPFFFLYSKYSNYTNFINKLNESMEFEIDKSFLKKNRDIIITKNFIDSAGINKIANLLYSSNKYYFLIDSSDTKNGKIIVRQVQFHYEPSH